LRLIAIEPTASSMRCGHRCQDLLAGTSGPAHRKLAHLKKAEKALAKS